MTIKTKIIATIGPSSNNKLILKKLISAGMNVARLNFSHGRTQDHVEVIKMIRSLSREMNKPIGILMDLQGPKIRTGRLVDGKPILLKRNHIITITTKKILGTPDLISTTYKSLPNDVKKNDKMLLDDGLIELKVISKRNGLVKCKVITGGLLKEKKGINLPGVKVSAPSLTDKDKRDLSLGIQMEVDYFALSFVRKSEDLKRIKSIINRRGSDIPVIAKIEKPEAVKNLDDILKAADLIMVARGDLGVELNPEQVPTVQKNIIQAAIYANKPVITATQMLETMGQNPIPTRAEASDVANAIIDGTDAVMLSGETATGKYPVKAVQMMVKIARQVESSTFMSYNLQYKQDPVDLITHAVAQSSVNILHELNAKGIMAFSVSGSTAKLISKKRPKGFIYAFTPNKKVYYRLSLIWGVVPLYISKIDHTEKLIKASENILIHKKLLKKSELIIVVVGLGLKKGSTNIIKIHRLCHDD